MGEKFSRYAELVSGPARRALAAVLTEDAKADSVLLAVPAARLLLDDMPADYVGLARGLKSLAAVGRANVAPMFADALGHRRDVYHPLVLHLHLAAFTKRYESLPPALWSACEDAVPDAVLPARAIDAYTDTPPPPERTAIVLWHALVLAEQAMLASRDIDLEFIDAVVHQVVRQPGEAGSLHPIGPGVSLDAWTYRELTGLHALANLALRRRNVAWAARVREVVRHHVDRTQPDNTTTQPWALFAFVWADALGFADQQIHDATTQAGTGSINPLSALLLADAGEAISTLAPDTRQGSDASG